MAFGLGFCWRFGLELESGVEFELGFGFGFGFGFEVEVTSAMLKASLRSGLRWPEKCMYVCLVSWYAASASNRSCLFRSGRFVDVLPRGLLQ